MATKPKKPQQASASTKKQTADGMLKEKKFDPTKKKLGVMPSGPETDRALYIRDRAVKMKAAKLLYSSRWQQYERHWKMLEEDRPDDEKWRANLPDTFVFAAIKTAQAAFIDSEVVPVFSRNQDDDLMRAIDMRDLYTDNARKGDQRMHLYLARLDAMKLGTGFLFTYYEEDAKYQWDIDTFDPETKAIKYTRKLVKQFDDPKSIRVSPYLVLMDEASRSDFKGTARDAILIEILSRAEAKLKYAHLVGGDEAFEARVPTTESITALSTAEIANAGIATTANNNKRDVHVRKYTFFAPIEMADDMVEILHYFCVRPVDSYEITINGAPIQVQTLSNPSPMPWIHKTIPITPLRYALYSGDEAWGQGLIEISYADAKASRQNREMMNDRQRLSLFSPVFSDTADEIDQKLLKLKPLSIIRTRGGVPNQFKIPGITNADLQMGADLAASIKRATGVDEALLGNASGNLQQYTATAVAFIRQMAFMRLKDFEFLYKQALIDEVRLKLKLFEQYYSSPLKQAPHLTQEEGLNQVASTLKEFNVKTGNVYTKKAVSSTLFTGAIEDIDLDEQALTPSSQAELITKWSQVIRDMTPFVQAGIIDLDMEKLATEYLQALDVNIDKIRKDPDSEAISMADGEHALLTNANTSGPAYDAILKDGTPPQFLTPSHLKRHQQLLANNMPTAEGDAKVNKEMIKNLIAHIAKDTENYVKKMQEQAASQKGSMDKLANAPGLGNIGSPGGTSSAKPPSVSMSYKDAPDDIKRQIEEALGYSPSEEPAPTASDTGKPPVVRSAKVGEAFRKPTAPEDRNVIDG